MRVTGSLRDKRGIYQMVIRVPTADGGWAQRSKSTQIRVSGKNGRETKKNLLDAQKLLASWIEECELKGEVGTNRLFTACMEEWLDRKSGGVRTDTADCYRFYYDHHIKPYFEPKKLRLADVTPRIIQQYVYQKSREGQSANSIRKHIVLLNGVFKEAIRMQELLRNPCTGVILPKSVKFRGSAYDADTARHLLEAVKGDPIETPVWLGLFLGLRRSEVAGLRWCDVDLDSGYAVICNTVTGFNDLHEQEQTKSEASRRKLYLPDSLREYLRAKKAACEANRRRLCGAYNDSGHVCQWPDGTGYRPDYITYRFRYVLEHSCLPKIRFHDLRHTAGSLLVNGGHSIKQVQEFLGHEKVTTTLDVYVHMSSDGKQDTAGVLDAILTDRTK